MKPSEIYAREPEEISYNIHQICGFACNHVPELDCFYFDWDKLSENTRVEVRCYKHIQIDHRRYWNVSGVFFDGEPVMIIQNAGREGTDHASRFITDKDRYFKMIEYLRTFIQEDDEISDVVSADDDVKGLGKFYGYSLED